MNPDNFIFHSDFWYPTGYLSGTKEYTNVDIPAQFEMSDKYQDGDYYNVYLEYPAQPEFGYGGGISEQFLSDTIIPYTQGNKLMVFKGAQSAGAKFTGKLHWRIYPKNKTFNFLSTGRLEQTAKSINGFFLTDDGVNVTPFTIPSGLTGKYFVRGTYQIEGQSWNIIGGTSSQGFINGQYDLATNAYKGNFSVFPVLPAGTKINYRLQFVPISSQDVFVFNSQKYSFAIPKVVEQVITRSATMAANATDTVYGDWITVPGSKTSQDLIVKWSGSPGVTNQHYREMQFTANITAVASIETSGNQVRSKLAITNYANSVQSYPTQTVTFGIYMYQNNNAS